jgi:hypothetical protein
LGRALSAGKAPTISGLALGDHQLRPADDEERRADDRQRELALQNAGNGHDGEAPVGVDRAALDIVGAAVTGAETRFTQSKDYLKRAVAQVPMARMGEPADLERDRGHV